jgi:neural Wiskott-Aldrich syndrome protein
MNEDARLMTWLSSHRGEAAASADPTAHVDVDTLTRHATGRLSPPQAQLVTEHLLVCDDARCVAFVRTQAADVDAATDFLYPPEDERSSSPRTFQCRDALWEMITEVATHTGLPIDEVINDAMLQYAHTRGYHEGPTARRVGEASPLEITQDAAAFVRRSSTTAVRADEELSESEPSARSRAAAHQSITAQRSPAFTPEAVPRAPPSVRSPAARPMGMPPIPASMPTIPAAAPPAPLAAPPPRRMPAPPGSPMGAPPPLAPPPAPRSAGSLHPPSSRRAPPPLPSTPQMPIAPQSMGSMSLSKRLVLTFEGQTYDVDKEHFILGRSKGQADLRIDDPNVSRQHAAIERIGSIYYLVDLGSTNGVYVGDDRVTRRALADGDTIVITTHRISCRLG